MSMFGKAVGAIDVVVFFAHSSRRNLPRYEKFRWSTIHSITAVALIVALVASFLWAGLADVRLAADRAACTRMLERIWIELESFATEHGDIPRGADGEFTLTLCVNLPKCPNGTSSEISFVPNVEIKSLSHLLNPGTIIAYEPRLRRHGIRGSNSGVALVLLSGGEVITWGGMSSEYLPYIQRTIQERTIINKM